MPEKRKEIIVQGKDADSILALAYGAFEILGWTIKHSAENMLLAHTPESWNRHDQEIRVEASGNFLTITSKMIHGESLDLLGKNKKHIADFENVFEPLKSSATDDQVARWKEEIVLLKGQTIQAANSEAGEGNKWTRFSTGNMNITLGLIAANILVFVIMGASGVNIFAPSIGSIIKWGGNVAELTVNGQWWRLITNCFVHIGLMHLLFNMYGLFFIGLFLEPMLGKIRFIAAYLCTGVIASLASLWWHQNNHVVSAGASGAIFGMFGVFLALLTTNFIPPAIRKAMLQSIVIFVGYNLLMGLKKGVDNSAHLGGLISGIAIGYLYYFILKQRETVLKKEVVAFLMVIGTFILAIPVVKQVKANYEVSSQAERFKEFMKDLPIDSIPAEGTEVIETRSEAVSYYVLQRIEANYGDTASTAITFFRKKLEKFFPAEEETINIYDQPGKGTLNDYIDQLASLNHVWDDGIESFSSANHKNLPADLKKTANDLVDYCSLYKEKTKLLIKFYKAKTSEQSAEYNRRLNNLNADINSVKAKIMFPSFDE